MGDVTPFTPSTKHTSQVLVGEWQSEVVRVIGDGDEMEKADRGKEREGGQREERETDKELDIEIYRGKQFVT